MKNLTRMDAVRLIKKELGFTQAHMPETGGFAVSGTSWDMVPVLFVHWAYAGDNMRERELTEEVKAMREMFEAQGYPTRGIPTENFFYVLPQGEVSTPR
jgi:hypothetical protein